MSIITISRQTGSLGNLIAGQLAGRLGYELISEETLHQMGLDCDAEFAKACSMYETEHPKGFWDRFFFSNPVNTSLFARLNYEIAAKGNAIILGRGAQVVLEDKPGVFRVRVVAPAQIRIRRIMDLKGLTEREADRFINWHDKQRRHLIESVFHVDLSDWSLYDMILNTAGLDTEAGLEILAKAVEEKIRIEGPADHRKLYTDLALAKKIELEIRKEIQTSYMQQIHVESNEVGQVLLTGFARSAEVRAKAENIAARHADISRVISRIAVIENYDA